MLARATPGDLLLREPAAEAAEAEAAELEAPAAAGAATVAMIGVAMIGVVKIGGITMGTIGDMTTVAALGSAEDEAAAAEAAELRFFLEAPAAAAAEAATGAGGGAAAELKEIEAEPAAPAPLAPEVAAPAAVAAPDPAPPALDAAAPAPEPAPLAAAAPAPTPEPPSTDVDAVEAAPVSPETVVVVVAEPLGNELVNKSLVAAPNNENGFVIALSNQAPDEAPPDASKFSAVPAILAIGLETVSSIDDLIPSENTLFAFDKLVAIFWNATPAVVTGLPTVSLYNLANPSVPVNKLSVAAV